jgi:hypothetical protein
MGRFRSQVAKHTFHQRAWSPGVIRLRTLSEQVEYEGLEPIWNGSKVNKTIGTKLTRIQAQ